MGSVNRAGRDRDAAVGCTAICNTKCGLCPACCTCMCAHAARPALCSMCTSPTSQAAVRHTGSATAWMAIAPVGCAGTASSNPPSIPLLGALPCCRTNPGPLRSTAPTPRRQQQPARRPRPAAVVRRPAAAAGSAHPGRTTGSTKPQAGTTSAGTTTRPIMPNSDSQPSGSHRRIRVKCLLGSWARQA